MVTTQDLSKRMTETSGPESDGKAWLSDHLLEVMNTAQFLRHFEWPLTHGVKQKFLIPNTDQ